MDAQYNRQMSNKKGCLTLNLYLCNLKFLGDGKETIK